MKPKITLSTLVTALLAVGLLVACGGGSGSGDGASTPASGETGAVAVLVTDAPAGAEKIWITIEELSLIPPEDEGNRKPVTIYTSKDHKINLLEYQNDNYYLLKLAPNVPAGPYEKIRLKIKDVEIEGGECDTDGVKLKLPSGRIDVHPRGTFEVVPGETLKIKLDMDAEKSINLHKAGKSGMCIFRPVVFADIEFGDTPPKPCPEILRGKIGTAFTETGDDDVEQIGFHLMLREKDRGSVEVVLDEDAVVYDGAFVPQAQWFDVLDSAYETRAKVRGTLDGNRLIASVVVIGDILDLKATVSDVTSLQSGFFLVTLDPDQELDATDPSQDPEIQVNWFMDTLVLAGCDQPFNPLNIEEGMRVRLFGKYDVDLGVLNAVAVLVKLQPVEGKLARIDLDTGLVEVLVDGEMREYILPQTASVFVGSAQVKPSAWDKLAELVNCREVPDLLDVTVKLDPESFDPTVSHMKIAAESVTGMVDYIDADTRRIRLTDGTLIKVVEEPILQKNSSSVDMDDIDDENDEITAYGLFACDVDLTDDAVDFYAYIVLASDDE